ncbi:MAG: hypothetical protein H0V56_08450 [Chthoniobacterales bacterium]|nr:hypothetical protein [Chthoniobacterales bacterium]
MVLFGADGDSQRFRRSGWSRTEPQFTWTEGGSAQLKFVLPQSTGPVGLRMRLSAFFKEPELPIQPIWVMANNTKVAEWHVAAAEDFKAIIPAQLLPPDGTLQVKLLLSRATSPKALGLGNDERLLGVRCWELEFTRAVNPTAIWPQSVTSSPAFAVPLGR